MLFALNPCNEDISQNDKDSYKILELNIPLFQCQFKQEKVQWQYNQTLPKDYDQTLKDLQKNFSTLSLEQAKGLRYAIYMQDSLNTIKKNNKNIFGIDSIAFTQKDINNMQEAIDFYYQQSIINLNIDEQKRFYLKLYGELEALKIKQQARDSKAISKEEISKSKEYNKKILQQIKDITKLNFSSESEENLYVDIVNNLAFIYNANLLINDGKDDKERKYKAYNESKNALELLEQLYLFTQKIQHKENQFISLQGSLITIQDAVMSIPIHNPFTHEDYEMMEGRVELNYLGKIMQVNNNKFFYRDLEKLTAQASNATYSQKQIIFQETFTRIGSIRKTLRFLDLRGGFMQRMTLAIEYEDMYLNNGK